MGKPLDLETLQEVCQEYNIKKNDVFRRIEMLKRGYLNPGTPQCDICKQKARWLYKTTLDVCVVCHLSTLKHAPAIPLGRYGHCHLCRKVMYLYEVRTVRACEACKRNIMLKNPRS